MIYVIVGVVSIILIMSRNFMMSKMAIVVKNPSPLSRGQCAQLAARAVIGTFEHTMNE